MPVIYPADVKNARLVAVRDKMDAGGAASKLEICSAGYATILATIPLGYPGATTGVVSGAGPVILTLAGFPRSDTAADATGIAAVARIRTSANVDVITGLTVGTSGTDVVIDNVNINVNQTVTVNSAVITHA